MDLPGHSKTVEHRIPIHQTNQQTEQHTHIYARVNTHTHTQTITGSYMIFRKDREQWGNEHLDILVVVQIITKKLCKQLRYKSLVSPVINGTDFLQPCLCVNSSHHFGFKIYMLYTFCSNNNSTSLGVGVARGLYSALWCKAPPPTCTYMDEIQYAYVSWPGAQKTLLDSYPQSNRKSAILISVAILTHCHASYFNEHLLQI